MSRKVPVDLPSTATAEAPAVLLPYQQRWIADGAQVKIVEKSRRTGLTWAEAADDVLIASRKRGAGGQNVWYIGYNLDMAREFIDACAMWARAFNLAAEEIEEAIFEDADKEITTFIIRFPGAGNRITALSSRPSNLRGKQGVVVLDEAAFHEHLDGLLKAALALLIWGGKVRIISTHNGDTNIFNELIEDVREGKAPYSIHRIGFKEAVKEGLYRRVCLRLNQPWSEKDEAQWVEQVYAYYRDDAAEELDVIPSSGEGAYLPRALIEACMVEGVPVLRLACPNTFAAQPPHIREAEIAQWCEEHLRPLLEALPENLAHYLGGDFARSADVSAFWPLYEAQDLRLHTPFLLEMRNVPFEQQRQALFYILDRLPRFRGAAFDARGNGQYLAEVAMQKFGAPRIAQVMLSWQWYLEHMPKLKARIEDRTMTLPRDSDVLADLRCIRKEKGVAKVPDDARVRGSDGQYRHGDAAVAVALAVFAAEIIDAGEIEFASTGRRASIAAMEGFGARATVTEAGIGAVAGRNDFGGYL